MPPNLPSKESSKKHPAPRTPLKNTATQGYFSASPPLEGDRSSEVKSLADSRYSSLTNSPRFATIPRLPSLSRFIPRGAPYEPRNKTHLTYDDELRAHQSKGNSAWEIRAAERKAEEREVRGSRTADEIVLRADLGDTMALSAALRRMNENGVREEEKVGRLIALEERLVQERERR
ncbi:hypothetical protein N0V90_010491 [Kalmusia sp. IMI 367209]|nr:hypothetical protein N0V90_010491 [Kalmusia sp. IMI 367209]